MRSFRETLWFKKGRQAEEKRDDPDGDQDLPVEDRYVDDGSVSAVDHARWSLHTGRTQPLPPARDIAFADGTGVHMKSLVGEMKTGSTRFMIAMNLVIAAVVGGLAAYLA